MGKICQSQLETSNVLLKMQRASGKQFYKVLNVLGGTEEFFNYLGSFIFHIVYHFTHKMEGSL